MSSNIFSDSEFDDPYEPKSMQTMRAGTSDASTTLGVVDHYRLVRKLGGGGFGVVYLARDTVADRDVAIKTLHPALKSNPEEMENVRSNFKLVSSLYHPNIAAALVLHQVGMVRIDDETTRRELRLEPGDPIMVMAYAAGIPLSKWKRQFTGGRVPLDKVLQIGDQLASALDYAHSERVVHRDIKPSNIMVETNPETESVRIRILDFGLAAEIRSSMGRMSQEKGDTSGTRPYMAPEQWMGRRQDARTDQYALACVLYELLAGAPPLAGVFETGDPTIMMASVENRQPDPVEGLDADRNAVLLKALAKKPDDRFGTCAQFVEALALKDGISKEIQESESFVLVTATAGGVEAPGASFTIWGQTIPLPAKLQLDTGITFDAGEVSYVDAEGMRWGGKTEPISVDWVGVRSVVVPLSPLPSPVPPAAKKRVAVSKSAKARKWLYVLPPAFIAVCVAVGMAFSGSSDKKGPAAAASARAAAASARAVSVNLRKSLQSLPTSVATPAAPAAPAKASPVVADRPEDRYGDLMEGRLSLPNFYNHSFDPSTGEFYRTDGRGLDAQASLWNERMRQSRANVAKYNAEKQASQSSTEKRKNQETAPTPKKEATEVQLFAVPASALATGKRSLFEKYGARFLSRGETSLAEKRFQLALDHFAAARSLLPPEEEDLRNRAERGREQANRGLAAVRTSSSGGTWSDNGKLARVLKQNLENVPAPEHLAKLVQAADKRSGTVAAALYAASAAGYVAHGQNQEFVKLRSKIPNADSFQKQFLATCPTCHGTKKGSDTTCSDCGGSGVCPACHGSGTKWLARVGRVGCTLCEATNRGRCRTCKGRGSFSAPCAACAGLGVRPNAQTGVDVYRIEARKAYESLFSHLSAWEKGELDPARKDDVQRARQTLDGRIQAGDAEALLERGASRFAEGNPSCWNDIEKASRRPDPGARLFAALCLFDGVGTSRDDREAFRLVENAAQSGLSEAMLICSHCFAFGIGTEKDPVRASEWYRKAREAEHGRPN